ncbi:DUF2179 domain-containing protein [Candidatus Woesearchaeota archaeon]|nr:DUF2179 domain-containing protein [Candidatus Woesearchaeota archaeon]
MDILTILGSSAFTYVIVPLLIFLARVIDVSIGTIRLIFISRGYKIYAPILGFFEILIWLAAITQIMRNLTNVECYLAYAAGFATGTYVGIVLEEKISFGKVIMRIMTGRDAKPLLENLRKEEFTVTTMGAQGPDDDVNIILSAMDRKSVTKAVGIIKKFNPNAFYSVEDVRFVHGKGEIPSKKMVSLGLGIFRKGK